jgi:hypothetical protein
MGVAYQRVIDAFRSAGLNVQEMPGGRANAQAPGHSPAAITSETWRDIPGYEGSYQASTWGNIRSLTRIVQLNNEWADTRWQYGRILKTAAGGRILANGQPDTRLSVVLRRDGKSKTLRVHVLVALTFFGERPDGMDVCHNNGDNSDNRIENLRYDTHSANELDKYRHGTRKKATHCKWGHEQTPENLYASKRYRVCKPCVKRRYQEKKSA